MGSGSGRAAEGATGRRVDLPTPLHKVDHAAGARNRQPMPAGAARIGARNGRGTLRGDGQEARPVHGRGRPCAPAVLDLPSHLEREDMACPPMDTADARGTICGHRKQVPAPAGS
jgi:hypothetical protein